MVRKEYRPPEAIMYAFENDVITESGGGASATSVIDGNNVNSFESAWLLE